MACVTCLYMMYDCVACLRWTFPRCLQCITKGQFRLWRWTDRWSTQGHTTLKALCALEAWLEEPQTKAKRKTVDCELYKLFRLNM